MVITIGHDRIEPAFKPVQHGVVPAACKQSAGLVRFAGALGLVFSNQSRGFFIAASLRLHLALAILVQRQSVLLFEFA
jgi:hypothetical protein